MAQDPALCNRILAGGFLPDPDGRLHDATALNGCAQSPKRGGLRDANRNPAPMPATPDELFKLLESMGIATRTATHRAVFTVAESEEVKAAIPGGHTKNLFVKDRKGGYFLVVAEGTARIDMNRAHGRIGAASRLSFAGADDLRALLGVEPGSVTAFAAMNDKDGRVGVVIDEALLAHDLLNCHPLTNTMTTTISKADLLRFLAAVGHPAKVVALSAPVETETRA
jgi:Ala-tRNA(Pro) deacylase